MEEPKKKSSRLRMNFKIFFFHACVLKPISGRNNLSEIGLFYMLFNVVTVGSGVLDTLYNNVIDIISVFLLPLAESSVGWHTYILLHDGSAGVPRLCHYYLSDLLDLSLLRT